MLEQAKEDTQVEEAHAENTEEDLVQTEEAVLAQGEPVEEPCVKEPPEEERAEEEVQKQQEPAQAAAAGPEAPMPMVRVLPVQATLPQDLHFTVPPGCRPGQTLCVQGPHGPLHVEAPPGCKPGERRTVRLAAPFIHEVFVPAGAKPGDSVSFLGPKDEELTAVVPPGARPGQVFQVSPLASCFQSRWEQCSATISRLWRPMVSS